MSNDMIVSDNDTLLTDLRGLIQSARERVAAIVNSELTMLYWHVGKRIRTEILKDSRAEYGKQIVISVAEILSREYGKGLSRPNLFRMVQFAEQFPEEQIVSTLSRQLSWSHFIEIFVVKDELGRRFYTELCKLERWSVRTLRDKINGMMYERTAISKKPEDLIARELTELAEEAKLRKWEDEEAARSFAGARKYRRTIAKSLTNFAQYNPLITTPVVPTPSAQLA